MAYKDGGNFTAGPLTITDGKVGVNNTAPTSPLHVEGTIQSRLGASGIQIYGTGGSGEIASVGSLPLVLNVNSSTKVLVQSTVEVQVTSGLLELDGNDIGGTQVTIADDAVASITPPRTGGFMFITCQGNNSLPQTVYSGLVFYDVGTSLYATKQPAAGGIGSNLATSTSDVTGTTGTDATITVAVQTGVIKIESRVGVSTTFQITFL
jgi:hypothetical protein